jgi:hypothetical protein
MNGTIPILFQFDVFVSPFKTIQLVQDEFHRTVSVMVVVSSRVI